ncbi:MAG TPA: hypothetical protein VNG32_04855, partial [Candidatus Dormibacteraeota bacterium]|nr:hypothetical protein [Candidatus Dormibacteraeota bacterium]
QSDDAIEGVRRKPIPKAESAVTITVKNASSTQATARQALASSKHPVNDARGHIPKTSQILMRSVVKKPGPGLKRQIKISENIDREISKIPPSDVALNISLSKQHPGRNQRAALTEQSGSISHFVTPSTSPVFKPVSPDISEPSPAPGTNPSAPPISPADILLHRALNRANAHEQPQAEKTTSKHYRIAFIAAPVLVAALLIIGVHDLTSLQLKVASAKAGFSTSLPAYHPAGFALNQLSYNSGIFSSEYSANNSNRGYVITQKSTSWNTQDLLNNYVATLTTSYRVVRLGNRTIYLYGNGSASWVSGGIWYQIDSDGSLSESQIIDTINSL